MTPMQNSVSIVIRVRNAAADLCRCLEALAAQTLPAELRVQIVVVDNDSTDDSADIARRHGAILVPISSDDFSWGRALNRGIAAVDAPIAVLLSADAWPADVNFLSALLAPFEDERVAAVYGRQIARPDAPLDEVVRIAARFPTGPVRYDRIDQTWSRTGRELIVSNACAAIRCSVWQVLHYDEEMAAGEEGPWSCNVLRHGCSIVYEPRATVYHSHRESPWKLAWREWEIARKNAAMQARAVGIAGGCRLLAAIMKRRLRNCFWPGVPAKIKLAALARLPADVMAAAVVGIWPDRRKQARWLFWK